MISRAIKFISSMSPDIEESIYSGSCDDDVFNYFEKIIDICKSSQNISIFIISANVINILKNRNIKFIYLFESVESDTNSKIIIYNNIADKCTIINDANLLLGYDYSVYVSEYISFSLYKMKEPIIFASTSYDLMRCSCDFCGENFICSSEWFGRTVSLDVLNSNFEIWKNLAGVSLEYWYFDADNFSKLDIKLLAFLSAVFQGYDENSIRLSEHIEMSDTFLKDLIGQSKENILNTSFCMLRTLAFPSSRRAERVRGSVDWHFNDPRTINHYNSTLLRVDVVDSDQTGRQNSGANRLLVASEGERKVFISFTDEHNFSDELIKERLAEVSNPDGKLKVPSEI